MSLWLFQVGCASPDRRLFDAATSGNVQQAAAALDKGAQINAATVIRDYTPLIVAIETKNEDVVKFLLDRGAIIDVGREDSGPTELSYAAMSGSQKITEMLISKGANIQKAIAGAESIENSDPNGYYSPDRVRKGIKLLNKYQGVSVPAGLAAPLSHPTPNAPTPLSPKYSIPAAADDYAVVMGIETYPELPAATYAERDAAAAKSFIRAMGVPERNIAQLIGGRATKTGMEKILEVWLPNNVSEKSRVFVFYSGHGAPDAKTGDAYLVPSDGDPQYLAQTGYPLKRLYSKLGELKAKSVLVALDSCFSGAGGRSVLAKGTRPLVGKVDTTVGVPGKVSVLSASAGDQISGADEEAGYGLFTYNFLQGLNGAAKDAHGRVTLSSLYQYLKPRVQDAARRANRDQVPQLQSGAGDLILRPN